MDCYTLLKHLQLRTETYILFLDVARLLKVPLIFKSNIKNKKTHFFTFFWCESPNFKSTINTNKFDEKLSKCNFRSSEYTLKYSLYKKGFLLLEISNNKCSFPNIICLNK